MMIGESREEKAIRRIIKIVLCIIGVFIGLSTVFFIKGTYEKLDEKIANYELEVKNEYRFTNVERLNFLNTDAVIEYKKLVQLSLQGEEMEGIVNITVLDTITSNKEAETYEWLIVCDDEANSIYTNTYSNADKTFSVTYFENEVDANKMTDEDLEKIKEEATEDDTSEFISGSITDIEGIEPTIKNLGALSGHIDDSIGLEVGSKLRAFLVETENNRRTFTVSTASVEEKSNKIHFVLHPEIELKKNNTIKAVYNKSDKTLTFEYTD